jgi:hypothetical protein
MMIPQTEYQRRLNGCRRLSSSRWKWQYSISVNFEWGGRVLDYGEDMNARDIQRLMFVADSAVFLDVFLAGPGGEVAIRQKMGAEK